MGCFLEVFRYSIAVPESELPARRLSRVDLPEIHLADCTSGLGRRFGLTGEIHTTTDYATTLPWAWAFAEAGFDGVHYLLRHDPRQRLAGVALFGPAGSDARPPTSSEPIGPAMVEEARRLFGIEVFRTV